ncbi:MAG: hypothetical protein ACRENG_01685 [bacterium]
MGKSAANQVEKATTSKRSQEAGKEGNNEVKRGNNCYNFDLPEAFFLSRTGENYYISIGGIDAAKSYAAIFMIHGNYTDVLMVSMLIHRAG